MMQVPKVIRRTTRKNRGDGMVCYNCGCRLSEHDFCTSCGADVGLYKKIMQISNLFYNEGLEKAEVRDLTGAITCLRQSLKFNKENVEARNLLGLVYFEMGEVVAALSEWVISKNLRPKKNIADDYIDMIQTNQTRLDSINQTIKKYNQALLYCGQESRDLAIIQLKKVLSLNPNFVRAHQLLALLFINSEEWDKARKELLRCIQIDTNNTVTMRYMKEVENMLIPEEGAKVQGKKKNVSKEILRYQSGNETIIQPLNKKESKGVSTLLNMGIGIIIGVAIACFLILPARIQSVKASINDELRVVGEQSDAKTATINEMEQQVKALTEENTQLKGDLEGYIGTDGALKATDSLILAAEAYLSNAADTDMVAKYLDEIDIVNLEGVASEAFSKLYGSLTALIGPELAKTYYDLGYADYKKEKYASAIPNLAKAVQYDATNGEALFYLANCYRKNNNIDKAKEAYTQVIELFPNTEKANKSKTYLTEINNATR